VAAVNVAAHIVDAIVFLDQFLGDAPWPLVAIKPRDQASPEIVVNTIRQGPKRNEITTEWIGRHNSKGYNIYFSPNPLRHPLRKKATKDDVASAAWLWADIDPRKKATAEEIEKWRAERRSQFRSPLPRGLPVPTWIIDSGRGFWVFWRFRWPIPVDGKKGPLTARIEACGKVIEQSFAPWSDNCSNIDRIARLPGTVNHKTGRTAGVVDHSPDADYELKDFPHPSSAEPPSEEQPGSSSDRKISLEDLPDPLRDRILRPVGAEEDHSGVFHYVVASLAEIGFCADAIEMLLREYPGSVPARYSGRLRGEIERCIKKTAKRTAQRRKQNDQRPVIHLRAGEIKEAVDAAEQALIKRSGLYQRGNQIVFLGEQPVITADKNEVPASRIFERGEHALAEDLAEAASFIKYDAREKGMVVVNPPLRIVRTLMQRVGRFRFPVLAGVINAPTLRPDGSLLSEAGYDAATGLFFDPRGLEFPSIPECPSRDDAEAALAIVDDLIRHFPFIEDVDRSVAISGILSYAARQSMRSAPLHAYTAPTAGSGKSKLVDVASVIATGREAGVIAQAASEDEMEKRIGTVLLEGRSIVAIDNCTHPLGGNFLCAMLTQGTVSIRILGKSQQATLETNVFATATGNNLVVSGDMTRRAILCRLDPKIERPELRKFDFEPVACARENRLRLVAAALTVMLAFKAAGKPQQATPLGSFEDWSSSVRDALIWLGRADPAQTMEFARATDNRLDDLASILNLWRAVVGPMVRVTCRKLIDKALLANNDELKDALMAVAGQGPSPSTRRLGNWLAQNANRRCNGMWIETDGREGGVTAWRLRRSDHTPEG
jgi:hypothetical protein